MKKVEEEEEVVYVGNENAIENGGNRFDKTLGM